MANTGNISITVSGGTPTATVTGASGSGGTIVDGVYTIDVDQDNAGTTVACSTPYGAAQESNLRPVEGTDS